MARMNVDEFVGQLRGAFGDELRAVVLYGSAASGEQRSPGAGSDLLVLVDSLQLSRLEAVGATVKAWTEAGNPVPFILTVEEWRRSVDVFPMEYVDILERHRVLHGDPPFGATRVDPVHLRHELEHEAMGALLHLRKGALAAGGDGRNRLQLLEVSKGTVLAVLRATLRLHGETPPTDALEVCDRAASVAGFDSTPFKRVVQHVRGDAKLSPKETGPLLASYVEGVERLVRHLDEFVKPDSGGAER
jgi:predicted nucleotidyltransferase